VAYLYEELAKGKQALFDPHAGEDHRVRSRCARRAAAA